MDHSHHKAGRPKNMLKLARTRKAVMQQAGPGAAQTQQQQHQQQNVYDPGSGAAGGLRRDQSLSAPAPPHTMRQTYAYGTYAQFYGSATSGQPQGTRAQQRAGAMGGMVGAPPSSQVRSQRHTWTSSRFAPHSDAGNHVWDEGAAYGPGADLGAGGGTEHSARDVTGMGQPGTQWQSRGDRGSSFRSSAIGVSAQHSTASLSIGPSKVGQFTGLAVARKRASAPSVRAHDANPLPARTERSSWPGRRRESTVDYSNGTELGQGQETSRALVPATTRFSQQQQQQQQTQLPYAVQQFASKQPTHSTLMSFRERTGAPELKQENAGCDNDNATECATDVVNDSTKVSGTASSALACVNDSNAAERDDQATLEHQDNGGQEMKTSEKDMVTQCADQKEHSHQDQEADQKDNTTHGPSPPKRRRVKDEVQDRESDADDMPSMRSSSSAMDDNEHTADSSAALQASAGDGVEYSDPHEGERDGVENEDEGMYSPQVHDGIEKDGENDVENCAEEEENCVEDETMWDYPARRRRARDAAARVAFSDVHGYDEPDTGVYEDGLDAGEYGDMGSHVSYEEEADGDDDDDDDNDNDDGQVDTAGQMPSSAPRSAASNPFVVATPPHMSEGDVHVGRADAEAWMRELEEVEGVVVGNFSKIREGVRRTERVVREVVDDAADAYVADLSASTATLERCESTMREFRESLLSAMSRIKH